MSDRRFTWFSDLTSNAYIDEAATQAEIDPDTLFNEMKKDQLTASTVVALAQAFGQRATLALAITGIIPEQELTAPLTSEETLKLLPDEELMLMFAERAQKNPAAMAKAMKESAAKISIRKPRN